MFNQRRDTTGSFEAFHTMVRALFVVLVAGRAAASTTVSSMSNTYALDSSECYAPTEEGGWGYCGAPTCRNQYI